MIDVYCFICFIVAFGLIAGIYAFTERAFEADALAIDLSTQRSVAAVPAVPYQWMVFYVGFVFASLKFMWDIRRATPA